MDANATEPRGMTAPIAQLMGVSKSFGTTRALSSVSLDVRAGETHALLGRNGAGKSTIVAALTGIFEPDHGEIRFNGVKAPRGTASRQENVGCLYQYSTLFPSLSVAENLLVDQLGPRGGRFVKWSALYRRAAEILAEWGVEVDPRERAENLSLEQRQIVELARALSQGSRFIILDEPTAQLDVHQVQRLFEAIRGFQRRGVAFLYISHFMKEVFEICDRATVMRDGQVVLSATIDELVEADLVRAMTGGEPDPAADPSSRPKSIGDVVLRTYGLALDGAFAPLDVELRAGQVVGIAGSLRSGATAVGRVLAGFDEPTDGWILLNDKTIRHHSVSAAIRAGITYVPQDRHVEGIVQPLSVAENITMTIAERLGPWGLVHPRRRRVAANELIDRFDIKVADSDDVVSGLSGGNQQKVVLGRALASDPRVLVLDTPTAGVDIVSTTTVFEAIGHAARDGLSVLIVSNTISELRACDVVHVMFDGEVTRTLDAGWSEADMVAAIEGVNQA